jgi:soluble lytic murein transglycosylase-like protein
MDTSILSSGFNSAIYDLMMQLQQSYIANALSSQSASGSTASTSFNTTDAQASPESGSFESMIEQASAKYKVPARLIEAVIKAESGYNPKAISSAGAEGLMQLMPGTARSLGVSNPLDPAQNIDGGTHFLRDLLDRYDGDLTKAVAAYNAGPGAVDRYGGIPPYRETQTYVQRVLGYYSTLSREA